MCCLQIALHEVIKHVHVNVDEKLACEITERKSDARPTVRLKTLDDFREEPNYILIARMPLSDFNENRVIDIRKELSYVAFQNPNRARVVS